MSLKQDIDRDLKAAMLAGDSRRVDTLRGVKSAILNEEVAKGSRDSGLDDASVTQLLVKEAKKRQESADLYRQGGADDRAQQELAEKDIIDAYLPEQISEPDLRRLIDKVVADQKADNIQAMGKVIASVKQEVGGAADGAMIASLVKERLAR